MPCSSRCCSCNGGKKSSTASKSNCSGGRCPPRPTTSRSCAGGRCSTGQAKKSSNKGNSCSSRAGCYGSSCYEDSCCSSGRCYYKESSSNNVSITNSKILEDTTTHSMAKKSVHPDRITDSQQYNRTAKQRAKDANSINSFIEEDIIEPSTSNGKSISKKKKLPENKGRKCNSGLSSTVKQSAKNKKTDNMENQVKARKQTTKFENMKGNGNGHSVKIKKEIKSEPMSNSSDSDYLDQLLSEDESMDTVEEYVMNNLDKYGQYLNETFSSSDDEPPSKQLKLAGDLIRVKQEPDNNSTDDDYSTDDDFDAFSEDLSDDSSDYDSDEYEYDSCSWNESSEADYDDDDDSEYEDFQRDYYDGHHLDKSDSDTDLDYIPEDDDDITIPKGSAITCDLTDENFTFESEKSQLIDYTCTDETENETSANISQLEMSVTPTETEKSEENDINEHFVVINAVISNTVLVVLKRKIFFNGCVSVKLVFGGAEIFGYEMKIGETLPVYSIYGHSSMYIRPTDRTVKDEHNLISSLKPFKEDFLNHDLLKLRRNCDPTKDTIILLEKTSNIALDTIDRFLGKSLIPPLSSFDKNSKWFQSEFCLQAKLHLEPSSPLRVDEDWDQIKLSAQSKILLVGGKGVGKSTMMRYLINSNINKFGKILLIDLDIGQPEMFLPQTISATVITGPLLHPGYLNATTMPTIAYMYGEINIVLQPIKYINCVMKLLLECASKAEFNNIPWIINTMGYNKGFGSEFIALFTRYISITDLIQINSTSANTSFPLDFTPEATNNFAFILLEKDANELLRNKEAKSFNYHKISAVRSTNEDSQGEKQLVAADLRTVRILAYLGRILKHKFDWFTDIQPISANLSDLTIVNSSACEEDLCETDLLQIINGNLVYLCESTTDHEMFKCHGLGIVRGIDWDQRKLFLLSSVSMSEMDKVNTIAISSIPLPATVILNQNPKVTGSILYAYNSLNSVGSKKVTQFSYRPSL